MSTNKKIVYELRKTRKSIEHLISPYFNNLLIKVENRLSGNTAEIVIKTVRKRKPTKKELVNKYFYM